MEDEIETEVELPTALFERAEDLAEEMKVSRDVLYALALEDFIARMEKTDAVDNERRNHHE